MHPGFAILTSRLARRIIGLFVLSAFLPCTILVGFAYHRVQQQLYEQSWLRMEKECQSYALSLLDRLGHMDSLARLYAVLLDNQQPATKHPAFLDSQLTAMFVGVGLYQPAGGLRLLVGDLPGIARDGGVFSPFLGQAGKTTVVTLPSDQPIQPVYLVIPCQDGGRPALLIAQPVDSVLWGIGANSLLPAQTELAVYGGDGRRLATTLNAPGPTLPSHNPQPHGNYLRFEYTQDREAYLATGWSLFLKSRFNAQTWTIVFSAATTDVFSAMLDFTRSFPLILALCLWIVLFLSLFFIRRTLAPLALLTDGTRRIGAGDFSTPVHIASNDEFAQLAVSFNTMAGQLGKQFDALALSNEINRSILSSLKPAVIVPRSLRLIAEFFACPYVLLAQPGTTPEHLCLTTLKGSHRNDLEYGQVELDQSQRVALQRLETPFILAPRAQVPAVLLPTDGQLTTFLALPLHAEQQPQGLLLLAWPQSEDPDKAGIDQARQFADQLAIALNNARLVNDLEHLSRGAVEALARTVDAKSKWTAGHSERVAQLAVQIGQALHCEERLLEQLFRGGLLHDIGKIGIPISILDKPGRLEADEYAQIKTHPEIGGKILEPIQPYQDIVPIITQHHELFDGSGYPHGLAGEEITLGARILCVADVYDALISQRPYRQGWVRDEVHTFIRDHQGRMFDPKVVAAFLGLGL